MPLPNPKKLRYGFSTGACMTALACGLWRFLSEQRLPSDIDILFLDGTQKNLKLITDNLEKGILQIQKDAGDDPDCTHGAILSATLFQPADTTISEHDYILKIGKAKLILHADHGIGLCTRKGLDCEEGKWAINKGPRAMLIQNLAAYGMDKKIGTWQLNISVENGEELAKKTLNAKLGIIGGISILGTTGHVKPFSHDAYIHTIKICTNAVKLTQGSHVVYGTGARSLKTARHYYPHLPENTFIPIADFIGKSIELAKEAEIQEISIACMAGKLCKYAAEQHYTHAHKEEQDLSVLQKEILALNFSEKDILNHSWQYAASVREVLCSFSDNAILLILKALAKKALKFFNSLYCEASFHILVCDFEGNLLFVCHSEQKHQKNMLLNRKQNHA